VIETLTALFSSAAGGGLFGLIGTGIHSMLAVKQEQDKAKKEIEMRRLDLDELRLQNDAADKRSATELALLQLRGQQDAAKAQADAAVTEMTTAKEIQLSSYAADTASYGGGAVDTVRGLVRPLITAYTLGLMTWIAWLLYDATGGTIADPSVLWSRVVEAILFLTITTCTWWFGSRITGLRAK